MIRKIFAAALPMPRRSSRAEAAHTRAFDNCFENDDGDEVAVAILRRSGRNPKLAANLTRYLDVALVKECDQQLALIPTRKLRIAAAATRARRTAAQAQPEEK